MAASISAVAAICASAPTITQGQKASGGLRQALAEREHHGSEEDEREWGSEQEAHMRRAHGAEPRGELALGGVAHGLRGGGDDRE